MKASSLEQGYRYHYQLKNGSARGLTCLNDILAGIAGSLLLIPLYFYVRHKNHQEGDYDPVFFKQTRIGKDGKPFEMIKFRSMIPNAEAILEQLMKTDPKIREECANIKN